jgi:hypothetical protein
MSMQVVDEYAFSGVDGLELAAKLWLVLLELAGRGEYVLVWALVVVVGVVVAASEAGVPRERDFGSVCGRRGGGADQEG